MEGLISTILPGIGAMANIHPLFVHFPIALLNSFLLLEFLYFVSGKDELRHAATWTLYLGALGAVAAVLAGLHAEGTLPHSGDIHDILERHEKFGIVVASLAVVMAIWRFFSKGLFKKKSLKLLHLFAGAVIVVIMTFGADLGGLMVYKYGAAVEAVPVDSGHDHAGGGHDADGNEEAGTPADGIKPSASMDKAALPLSGDTPKAAPEESEVKEHHHAAGDETPHGH